MKFNKISLVLVILLAAISVAFAAGKSSEKTLKAAHSDLTCFDCHLEENPTHSLKVSCESCHGTADEVAKLTADKHKEHYNPHMSLHYGQHALCENCHREHEPSRLECNNPLCHSDFSYDVP